MTFRSRAPVAAVLALLALSACESATSSSLSPQGTVTFTYAGDEAGTFAATGRFDRLRPGAGTFAVGSRATLSNGEEAMLVLAHVPRDGNLNLADEFLLTLSNPALGETSCEMDEADCPFSAAFFLGASRTGQTEDVYTAVSGTVNVTSINEDRVRGTFSLEMESSDADEQVTRSTQLTSGTFDVPFVPNIG